MERDKDEAPKGQTNPTFYSIREVAGLLGIHPATVSGFVSRGELRAARLGHRTVRITHGALMDFLRAKEEESARKPTRRKRGKAQG